MGGGRHGEYSPRVARKPISDSAEHYSPHTTHLYQPVVVRHRLPRLDVRLKCAEDGTVSGVVGKVHKLGRIRQEVKELEPGARDTQVLCLGGG